MPYIRFPVEVVSPMFLAGADQDAPEIRSQSIRGALRFWYRAMKGASVQDTAELFAAESSLFGSTGMASLVQISVDNVSDFDAEKHEMLPHRQRNQADTPSIPAGTRFDITIHSKYEADLNDVWLAMTLLLVFGGLGRRSRRAFGAIQLRHFPSGNVNEDTSDVIDSSMFKLWLQLTEMTDNQPQYLDYVVKHVLKRIEVGNISKPSYSTLHPSWSRVLVGSEQNSFGTMIEANQKFFDVTKHSQNVPLFKGYLGSIGRDGRKASAVTYQVRKIGNRFYPVWLFMNSSIHNTGNIDNVNKVFDNMADSNKYTEVKWGQSS